MADRTTPRQYPLSPMPIDWLRGPAWIDGDDIVMDATRASTYQPLAEPGIGIELARVRTPDDAVEFVGRFGLLSPSYWPPRPAEPPREPYRSFETVGEDLRYILESAELVRRGSRGDAEAMRQLRQELVIGENETVQVKDERTGEQVTRRAGDVYSPYERFVGVDDRTILTYANEHLVARRLDDALMDSALRIHDRAYVGEPIAPGRLRLGIEPGTLQSVCYLSVALMLADQVPIGICADPDCGRHFVVTDKRQRFCTRACGNRVRFQRFTERHGKTASGREDE